MWNKTYIFSLSYGFSKSVPHWYIYLGGDRKSGVRLGISYNHFLDFISSIEGVFPVSEENKPISKMIGFETKEILDVMYTFIDNSDNLSLKLNEYKIINLLERFGVNDFTDLELLQGHLKDRAWEFENETRIMIVLKNEIEHNKIAIKLLESLIKSFEITCNPWLSSEKVKKSTFEGLNVLDSKLIGAINHLGNAK